MPRLQILLGALLFSTGGVAIKLATLSGWQVAALRALVAAIVLLALCPSARRGWTWRTLVVAVPYAATFVLYTLANKTTTAANAIFLQDTAPLYLLILAPLLLRERIERADLALLAALCVGATLLFAGTTEPAVTAPNPTLGNTLALASGFTWALSLLGLRWITVRRAQSGEEPLAVIVAGCALAFAISSIAELPALPFPRGAWTVPNALIVTYLGACQIALAYVLVTRGLRTITALEGSLLLLSEPVFAPLWALLLLDERPTALALLGGALVIAAVGTNAVLRGVSSAARLPRSA